MSTLLKQAIGGLARVDAAVIVGGHVKGQDVT